MCRRPSLKEKKVATLPAEASIDVKEPKAVTPSHSQHERNTGYDALLFLGPALFWKFTPVLPILLTGFLRVLSARLIMSLHYIFVDKDNYHNKLSQKQLKREKDDYLVGILLHMWAQVGLQLVFPSMFFSDSSEIWSCAIEAFWAHVLIVEPLYYAVHRWLHVPENMKSMHGFHHLSIHTTPSTSLVQNFQEHFVYVATFGPAFLVPWLAQGRQHWVVIGAYLVMFDAINAWGHTNIRVDHWLFTHKYSPMTYMFYMPEFHLGHHAYFRANYGLFMPIWDHLLGTYREYKKPDMDLKPANQQDIVFIGHNGGLGHLLTCPEFSIYNVYDTYWRSILPFEAEFFIVHLFTKVARLFIKSYACSRYLVNNQFVGRIICVARSPWDYGSPNSYNDMNDEIVDLIRDQYKKCGTRYFGLGNLNKMKQLNDGGKEVARLIDQDPLLKDKVRVWTGDTMTSASVYNQIADIPDLDELFYIGANGKIGTVVCQKLFENRPNLKIRIFSRYHGIKHPNVSYCEDLREIIKYKVVLVGKILPSHYYTKAFGVRGPVATRYLLDYTVPFIPITAATQRREKIQHIQIGVLKSQPNNHFLKGHYDVCMSHDQNHIYPCHFGCIMNMMEKRETNETGDIDQDDMERLWKKARSFGFGNKEISYVL
jgi:sterol desaturase/sphingolipid hydroxylase (fatty acid hydroxylase superfamily)|eukprot:CAMPEP_0113526070 /NCGR_PEP_ID=MMETSP0015_2-20120614/539_1 /TAXON_ID=2838 /ORGANISM="Odontella" /LENGTH=652 /DNA_ID=CAMNT_0000424359 /DNA_START=214 /DNA_END=2172 /DNA_ORIENTATION=- /assembly_acc=CAM_ASM_000160